MITSESKFESIEGLTKREQSKLQRLIKSDERHKARNEGKSYKRKSNKSANEAEPQPRKYAKAQPTLSHAQGDSGNSPLINSENSKHSPSCTGDVKRVLKDIKPLNERFPLDGGEAGLFDYIIGYVCTQKQKQLEEGEQDLTFLDSLEGKQLEIILTTTPDEQRIELVKKFQQGKSKIKQPFDQDHKKLVKISIKDQKDK